MSVWCLQVYKIVNRTECENSTWNQNLAGGCQSPSKETNDCYSTLTLYIPPLKVPCWSDLIPPCAGQVLGFCLPYSPLDGEQRIWLQKSLNAIVIT